MPRKTAMLFSKKGDGGFTSLIGGGRVLKSDRRVETYGTLDEASSALGLARASARGRKTRDMILSIQKDLLLLGAELATDAEVAEKFPCRIGSEQIERMEHWIEELQNDVVLGKDFILPGETAAAAAIDLARTMIRRAERSAVSLRQEKVLADDQVLPFLNRLADLLFTLARYEEMHT